ncbi:DMT family transporter [Mangrovibacillus cuniculi]|uniref:DMT family transporter n=1 Tax=Mangrovibacillus cuniculi TaxID=2593652 RepID=A0A7S8CAR4_9BACI|nr:DMT family transporter [Mangrovibacillus cuniculi]QPC46544.1 DMT family transporter [Mangrovibacillus cuniculi]
MTNYTKGMLLLLASAFGFAVMSAFVKLSGDLPTIQKTFFRNGVTALVTFFLVIYFKESFFGKKENQALLLLRSALGTLGIVFLFYAIDHLVLADATMLNNLSPFLLIIFCAIFLKENVSKYQAIGILFAFIGTLFVIKPQFSFEFLPFGIGLLSAAFAAGAYTVLRVLGPREKFYTVVFYFSFFSSVVLLPFVLLNYEPMTIKQWVYLIGAGVFATIGQFGITLAYKFAAAREISIFNYSSILYSALLGFWLFQEIPDVWSFLGYLIIVSAAVYMYLKGQHVHAKRG